MTDSQQDTQLTQADSDPTSTTPNEPPNQSKTRAILGLGYDIIMLLVIVIDLTIISIDLLLMSKFAAQMADWLNVSQYLRVYTDGIHFPLRVLGGFFTIFLIVELALRWGLAIINKTYSRWFFFPFAHWYEVLGCFPQFRALRLLRAFFIGRKLYQLGYQVLPKKWIAFGKFYYDVIFEELSDRVILTSTDNLRQQFADEQANQRFLDETLNKNRGQIEQLLSSMLKQELTPKLQQLAQSDGSKQLASEVGAAVQEALYNTPELRRYLRMIPIAGGLIESELHTVSQNIGQNITRTLISHLTQPQVAHPIIDEVAKTIANIELDNPELEQLVSSIVNDGLTAFEQQVKVQQWKHQQQLHL
ncbi:hypothetical protein [Psychrobacter sp. FDAARGOS_221]|uniref:hypothetical protein n=1 Tax=Psychrobacter sp. FDAARGOS_221 TaxID=1975705 RepID=UPI000BB59894|nr:hypothetical protein [Psychrobacter sp. FDAARGOS_221]PNK61003.1 hypothetical protein A6J60_008985 [Psychrobacter sp. FDAARGOS_221]